MVKGHFHLRPAIDTQGRRTFVGTAAEEGRDRDHVALAGAAARDALQLAALLERVNPDVRVGADAHADPALADLLDGTEAVARFASVVGQTQTRDPLSAIRSSSCASACVACTTVECEPRQPDSARGSIRRMPGSP